MLQCWVLLESFVIVDTGHGIALVDMCALSCWQMELFRHESVQSPIKFTIMTAGMNFWCFCPVLQISFSCSTAISTTIEVLTLWLHSYLLQRSNVIWNWRSTGLSDSWLGYTKRKYASLHPVSIVYVCSGVCIYTKLYKYGFVVYRWSIHKLHRANCNVCRRLQLSSKLIAVSSAYSVHPRSISILSHFEEWWRWISNPIWLSTSASSLQPTRLVKEKLQMLGSSVPNRMVSYPIRTVS